MGAHVEISGPSANRSRYGVRPLHVHLPLGARDGDQGLARAEMHDDFSESRNLLASSPSSERGGGWEG